MRSTSASTSVAGARVCDGAMGPAETDAEGGLGLADGRLEFALADSELGVGLSDAWLEIRVGLADASADGVATGGGVEIATPGVLPALPRGAAEGTSRAATGAVAGGDERTTTAVPTPAALTSATTRIAFVVTPIGTATALAAPPAVPPTDAPAALATVPAAPAAATPTISLAATAARTCA